MKKILLRLTTDQIINCIPSNLPIYKDSGLWNIYDGDQFKDELFHQRLNEPFKDFLIRSILGMIKSDEVETESIEIDIALCSADKIKMSFKNAPDGARFRYPNNDMIWVKINSHPKSNISGCDGNGLIAQWNGNVQGFQSYCSFCDEESGIDFNTEIELV